MKVLDGWQEIVDHLHGPLGAPERTLRTWQRLAADPADPLPLYARNGQRYPGQRIQCDPAELAAWWARFRARAQGASRRPRAA